MRSVFAGPGRIVADHDGGPLRCSRFSVEEIQYSLRDVLNVGMDAEAYLDGKLVEDKSIVVAGGQRLEFMRPCGQKGVGQTWTKDEFMQVFHMTEADWSKWAAKGLPFDAMGDGTIVLNEKRKGASDRI